MPDSKPPNEGGGNSDPQRYNEIFGEADIELSPPAIKQFRPWHKPRKQFVRREQWLAELSQLANDEDLDEKTFRYFSLPGQDLLDIRYLLESFCEPRKMTMRFLGFDQSTNEVAFNSAMQTIRHKELVENGSTVHNLRLQDAGNPTSRARKHLHDHGPFQAINLDLCDGFAGPQIFSADNNLFAAMQAILELQGRTQQSSLVFITTRIDDANVDGAALEAFAKIIDSNVSSCLPFSEELEKHGQISEPSAAALGAEDCFLVGIAKWLLEEAHKAKLDFDLRSVLTYKVNGDNALDDLASIALRLSPNRDLTPDDHGLSSSKAAGIDLACAQAKRIPGCVIQRRSVDQRLADDPEVRESCLSESESLLTSAGMQIDGFRDWAEEK